MQYSTDFTKVKHRKKELRNSSGNSSSLRSHDSEHDPESSLIRVTKSRKKRKHKHRTSDLENVHIIYNGHNEKHLRHSHHHHRHHRHGHSSRVKEGWVHKRICPVHEMSLKAVRVKKEPLDGDNGRIRQPLSSHRKLERRLASSDHHDHQVVR
jgi:hypothetical protein